MSAFWACAATHVGEESVALRNLRRQNFTSAFYPFLLLPSTRHRAGRTGLTVKPVFPGYVFLELDDEVPNWACVNSTYGVKFLLTQLGREGDYRKPSRAGFIDSLRRLRQRREGVSLLPPGTTVRIKRGPFAEQVALVEMAVADRVRLLLQVFSREVAIDFDVDDVQLVQKPAEVA